MLKEGTFPVYVNSEDSNGIEDYTAELPWPEETKFYAKLCFEHFEEKYSNR